MAGGPARSRAGKNKKFLRGRKYEYGGSRKRFASGERQEMRKEGTTSEELEGLQKVQEWIGRQRGGKRQRRKMEKVEKECRVG
jgi:hypothetical protein